MEVGAPAGLVTVMGAVPALATSVAGMAAVSWVALTKLVVRAEPLKLTTAPLTKFEPLTVNRKCPRAHCRGCGSEGGNGRRSRIVVGADGSSAAASCEGCCDDNRECGNDEPMDIAAGRFH